MNQVQLNFTNEFSGELSAKKGRVAIGSQEGALLPYELLAGALGSCLYATFLDVVKKMRLDFTSCTLEIEWEKREEVPTTMKTAHIKARIVGADEAKKAKYEHAFVLATEYCSIYHTLSQVATLTYEVTFA